MAFLNTLKDKSNAYAAYTNLQRSPRNCPIFSYSPHGYPIIEAGEIFCRLEGVGRPVCGAKEETTDHLLYHMEAVHGAMRRDRPLEKKRKVDLSELERVHYFYKHLMKDEEYPGKAMRTAPLIPNPEPPRPILKRNPSSFEDPSINDLLATSMVHGAPRNRRLSVTTSHKQRTVDDVLEARLFAANVRGGNTNRVCSFPRHDTASSGGSDVAYSKGIGLPRSVATRNAPSPPMMPRPVKRQRVLQQRKKNDDAAKLQLEKTLQEIAVKESKTKSDLKESQLRETRIKAELLEIQLVEAQIQQEVQQEKLKHMELEKELQEILASETGVRENATETRVVDLLDDESDE